MSSTEVVHLVCTILAPALALVVWLGQRYLLRQWRQIARLRKQVLALTADLDALRKRYDKAKVSWQQCYAFGTVTRQKLLEARRQVADLKRQLGPAYADPRPDPKTAILQGQVNELEGQLHQARSERQALRTRARDADERAGRLAEELRKAQLEAAQIQGTAQQADAAAERLRQAVREQEQKIESLNDEYAELKQRSGQLEDALARATAELEEARAGAFDLQRQIAELEEQIEGAVEQPGRVWERPADVGAPAFVPLAERRAPVVSVVNLKGGVGKTTIAANLAVALGRRGARVLLIDLDYQRSLSLLCCSPKEIEQLHTAERCLQHFLLDPVPDAGRLLRCVTPVKTAAQCSAVVNSEALTGSDAADSLEDAEMHLLAEWLMNAAEADVRLHLRRALHAPAVRKQFDYVLLDCPPRLSTACVNALAASDFALIPVLLDTTSAVSAPNLLRKLRRLRGAGLLEHLRVLGVLANRVRYFGGKLTNAAAAVWDEMRPPCHQAWGEPVHFFETTIKESSSVAAAAQRHADGKPSDTFAAQKGELQSVFAELADQVKGRIDHECHRPAAVPP
jgi:cellulose biosynthesis protein BcsQ/predicted  nucleic acid-binding Zn-ribbon protein